MVRRSQECVRKAGAEGEDRPKRDAWAADTFGPLNPPGKIRIKRS